jgi:hypothetical protein
MTMSRGAGPNNSTATSWNPTDERFGQGAQCPFDERNRDVGPAADGHGTTEDHVGGANASSPDANATQQDN